jgi:hypothetical protein
MSPTSVEQVYDDDYDAWDCNCVYVGATYSLFIWTGAYTVHTCAEASTKESGNYGAGCSGTMVGFDISVGVVTGVVYLKDIGDVPGESKVSGPWPSSQRVAQAVAESWGGGGGRPLAPRSTSWA